MTTNILHVYREYEAAFNGFKAVRESLTSFEHNFRSYEPRLKIRLGNLSYSFSVCATKEDAWKHAGMHLNLVVFHPHEGAFDKDVVQYLKRLVRQTEEN